MSNVLSKIRRRDSIKAALLILPTLAFLMVFFAFLYLPIFSMIVFFFNDSRLTAVWRGFTLKWYVSLLGSDVWGAFYNTILVAVIVTVVSIMLGTATALAMSRYKFNGPG